MRIIALLLLAVLALPANAEEPNPLLEESPLPYRIPPFEQIKDEHFGPAIEKGMAEQLAEVAAIANNPDPPTFENTVVALDRCGALMNRAMRAFSILGSGLTTPAIQKLETDIAPKLAAHGSAIMMNPALFARIESVYNRRASLKLDPEALRLAEDVYDRFVLMGAKLSPENRERLKALQSELARLTNRFRQNVLKEVNASAVPASREELNGLSESAIKAAQQKDGSYLIRLINTTEQPPLAQLENAALRRRIMDASLARNNRGGEFDNRAVVVEMARKRAEMAKLLGFPSSAAMRLKHQTAGDVETVNRILARIAPAAVQNARREAAELQKLAGDSAPITAADWAFYTEKLRSARYAFDESQLRPYYEVRRVLNDGILYAATKLYGITFKERRDLKAYSPDMFAYEVFNSDGSALGLFLADFYARPNKRGGAWQSPYSPDPGLAGTKSAAGMHLNVPKPPEGQPALLTHTEVNTAFHEFGHVLHQLFKSVKYGGNSRVPRDFGEFPSQVNEMWATWPEVFENYAKHYQTGAPMPKELAAKIRAAAGFNEGYLTTQLVAATILDQAWHQLAPEQIPTDAEAFEAAVLKKHGLDFPLVPTRYRSAYFSHIFAGGYSAAYYSYLWSEVFDADAVAWFRQNGGLKRANGDRFRKLVLSRGGSKDAKAMYREFRGADADPIHLLKRRGLN